MPDLEQRLRSHLRRVVATPPAAGMDLSPIRQTSGSVPPRSRIQLGSILASAALLVLGIGLFFGLSAHRDNTVAKPKPAPSATALPSGTPIFLELRMIGGGVGWALTDHGVLRTTDDWSHSSSVAPAGVSLAGASATFLNGNTAWVAVPQHSAPRQVISIFGTADGGRTWRQSSVTDTQSLGPAELDFVDPLHGWLMVSYGAAAGSEGVGLYSSTDGGAHWNLIEQTLGGVQGRPGSLPFGCDKTGIAFVNALTGWATGECNGGPPFFYVTRDAGRSWSAQALPGTSNLILHNGSTVTLPTFFPDGSGYFTLTADMTQILYSTRDAGTTWRADPLTAVSLGPSPLVAFSSLSDGWAVSRDGSLVSRSNDVGQHWTSFRPVPTLSQPQDLVVEDATHAIAVVNPSGSQSVLVETSDGGRTWSTRQLPG